MLVGAVDPEQSLHRLCAIFVLCPINIRKLEKTLELFDEAGLWIVGEDQMGNDLLPAFQHLRCEAETTIQSPSLLRADLMQPLTNIEGPLKMPAYHAVGESVVIHVMVILIWSNHLVNSVSTVFMFNPFTPKQGRFEDHGRTDGTHEFLITRDTKILPNGICDIGSVV